MTFGTLIAIGSLLGVAPQRPKPLPPTTQPNTELAQLVTRYDELSKKGDLTTLQAEAPARRTQILALLASDRIGNGSDFYQASRLFEDRNGFYESQRVKYELALMTLALGDGRGPDQVRMNWDALLMSLGHRPHFLKPMPGFEMFIKLVAVPLPSCLDRVFQKLPEAKALAAKAMDNEEIRKLMEADQAARQGKIDPTKFKDAMREDTERRKRVKSMLDKGTPKTPADFKNLALVMQHGQEFADFELAHELVLAAVLLGHDDPWLVSATYDRMLLSEGHRQRFGTQFNQDGIQPIDPEGLNDRARLQYVVPTLAELKAREKEILQKSFGG